MNHTSEPKWDFRDDFITVIDNALPKVLCEKIIWYFEKYIDGGFKYDRKDSTFLEKSDLSFNIGTVNSLSVSNAWDLHKEINAYISGHFETYFGRYDVLSDMILQGVKIQKTNPGQGYHEWHADGAGSPSQQSYRRSATFIYYLNDIMEGGETEFLYQKQRVSPVTGRGVWFPSTYTHVHRGNPPLTETKYILTGWFEYSE